MVVRSLGVNDAAPVKRRVMMLETKRALLEAHTCTLNRKIEKDSKAHVLIAMLHTPSCKQRLFEGMRLASFAVVHLAHAKDEDFFIAEAKRLIMQSHEQSQIKIPKWWSRL